MATIGRRSAVVELPHGVRIRGTLAWLAWLGLHLFYLLGGRNRLSALLNLSYRYLIWGHGGGVIVGDDPPAPCPAGRRSCCRMPRRVPGPRPGERCLTRTVPAPRGPAMPAPLARPPATPPERLAAGPLVLRRVAADDAGVIAAAVGASLEHLRPWMPWATPEAADLRTQLVRVAEADELWETGTGFIYVMIARDAAGRPPGRPVAGATRTASSSGRSGCTAGPPTTPWRSATGSPRPRRGAATRPRRPGRSPRWRWSCPARGGWRSTATRPTSRAPPSRASSVTGWTG